MEERDKVSTTRLLEFRAEIDRRLASLDRVESIDGEEFFDQLEREETKLRCNRRAKL